MLHVFGIPCPAYVNPSNVPHLFFLLTMAGLLRVPDFDEVVNFHLPPPASETFRPFRRDVS
jgi:hypothetical protein